MAGLIPGVENIGKRERRKRLAGALFMFLAGLGLAVGLIVAKANPLWRLTVAAPIFLAGLGYFQAQARTCVYHAMRGTCNLDQGTQLVADATLKARLVRRAQSVVFLALAFTTLVTAAITVLPF